MIIKYSSSSDRKNKDDLGSLMNMFQKGLFPSTLLYPEYTRAYEEAKSWSKSIYHSNKLKFILLSMTGIQRMLLNTP